MDNDDFFTSNSLLETPFLQSVCLHFSREMISIKEGENWGLLIIISQNVFRKVSIRQPSSKDNNTVRRLTSIASDLTSSLDVSSSKESLFFNGCNVVPWQPMVASCMVLHTCSDSMLLCQYMLYCHQLGSPGTMKKASLKNGWKYLFRLVLFARNCITEHV